MGLFDRVKKSLGSVVGVVTDKAAFAKSSGFAFGNTKKLADYQDALIDGYNAGLVNISDEQMIILRTEPWVNLAIKFAPGNLIIRQYCLIDLFSKCPANRGIILSQFNRLRSFPSTLSIWYEGYSYWLYTKKILSVWLNVFGDDEIASGVESIDTGFLYTSYKRNGLWYPAPFGDLRDIPIEGYWQQNYSQQSRTVGIVKMSVAGDKIVYRIAGHPVGLNTHIPKDETEIIVTNGNVDGFRWYEGYDKKYKNKDEEYLDTFDPKRIASI